MAYIVRMLNDLLWRRFRNRLSKKEKDQNTLSNPPIYNIDLWRFLSTDDGSVSGLKVFESCIDRLGHVADELAERLLSESMDRLAIVARDISDLAAETAIDLALIEAKRGQIDRAQAENWALLRELTGQAQ